MGFTPAQQKALDIQGRDVLVSAAAGSGKTYTLTHRIIKNILEKNADISKMLVVTFTRSAAGDLKSKISEAIMKAIAENPGNKHLQNQMLLLGEADICTIDSFLSRPVRENFEKLKLPVSMRIGDDAEVKALSHSILEDVMGSLYAKYGVCGDHELADINLSTPLTDLLALLTTTVKDSSEIIPFLINLHGKLITSPRGVELLRDFAQRLYADADKDFLDTREGQLIVKELSRVIEGGISFYDFSYAPTSADPLLAKKYLPTFIDDRKELISISEAAKRGYGNLRAKINAYPSQKLGIVYKHEKTPLSIRLHESRNEIINQIKNIRTEYLCYDQAEISVMYKKTAQITEVLYTLLSDFDRKFTDKKKELGIYEFSDMPRYMIELLQNPDGSPSEAAKILSESYDEIYIDEYQDVNAIQDTIFKLLSRHNRFMVGDIKQSIYGFRDTEPQFFSSYREKFTPYDPTTEGEVKPEGSTILMSNNFRSDETVIDFSNAVCAPIFKACGKSIGYTSDDDLVYTRKRPAEYAPSKVEVHVFGKGDPYDAQDKIPWAYVDDTYADGSPREDGLSEEAVFVANKIAELIRTGTKVIETKEGDFKEVKLLPKDIAILVRKNKSIPIITAALRRLNINYLLASKKELLQSPEMILVTELMSIINNPRDDVPLCGVLCSELMPFDARFSMGEMVSIRSHFKKKMSLYDSICEYGADGEGDPLDTMLAAKCRAVAKRLTELRELAIKLSADKILRALSADEYFSAFCEGEAFRFVYDSACKYTKTSWSGLCGFVRYFENIVENGSISGEVQRVDDCVNIVTMHSSKGLQYSTCFLFDCGRVFDIQELDDSIIYNKDLCVGMHIPAREEGEINTRKLDSIIHETVKLDIESRSLEEEMRTLYVALTRAEDRLFVTGTISGNSTFKSFFGKYNLYGISNASTKSQASLMSWVIGAMFIDGHNKSTYNVTLHPVLGNTPLTDPIDNETPSESEEKSPSRVQEYASIMACPPSLDPDEVRLSSIPSKLAASKVAKFLLDESVFPSVSDNAMQSDEEITKDDKRADSKELIRKRLENMRSQSVTFDSLIDVNKKPTAAERGTAMHAFLQFCDYNSVKENGVRFEIDRLRKENFISQRTADILNVDQLDKFLESDFFEILLSAENVRREFKFGMFRDASDFTENEELARLASDRKIFVQGSVDLLIENRDGSIYLCDYKTDKITEEERENPEILRSRMTEAHKPQLDQYSYAIEKIFGKKPERTYILSLALGDAVEIK